MMFKNILTSLSRLKTLKSISLESFLTRCRYCYDKTCELIMWLIKWLNCYYLKNKEQNMNSCRDFTKALIFSDQNILISNLCENLNRNKCSRKRKKIAFSQSMHAIYWYMRSWLRKSINNTTNEIKKQFNFQSFDVAIAIVLAIVLAKIFIISTRCLIEMNDS